MSGAHCRHNELRPAALDRIPTRRRHKAMQIRCIRAQHRLQTGMPAEKGDSSAVAAGGKKQEHEAKGVKEEDTDCTARAAVLRLKVSVLKSPLHGDFM